jgi:hypothetical protein
MEGTREAFSRKMGQLCKQKVKDGEYNSWQRVGTWGHRNNLPICRIASVGLYHLVLCEICIHLGLVGGKTGACWEGATDPELPGLFGLGCWRPMIASEQSLVGGTWVRWMPTSLFKISTCNWEEFLGWREEGSEGKRQKGGWIRLMHNICMYGNMTVNPIHFHDMY